MRGYPVEVSGEAAAAHAAALVVDLHNDVLTKLTHSTYDFSREHGPAAFYNPLRLDLDLPRIKRGGLDALGCLMFSGFRIDPGRRRFWRQLERARELAEQNADTLTLARNAGEIRAARAAGRVALFLGVEGSYAIDDDVENGVARLAEAGVMFLGPLWERDSGAGSSCRTAASRDRGLTDGGRVLVRACDAARDPPRCRARQPEDLLGNRRTGGAAAVLVALGRRRRLSASAQPGRRQIRALAARGGVVGVIFVAPYLGGTFCTLERVADHIEHVARIGGEDCVALGSDFDGFLPLPRGLRDAGDLPRLTEILWRRGWRGARLAKLLGENALRFFAAS